ncbi:hypothetical protein [Pseudomonas abietaniphila]|uniref:hypothetical protein n=1 Tax=Pseudomonas abietaniphila TaxID=89065 RepID=UPI0007837283|nr:hypothetical protein [Pseudomonas abietaniphila]
MNFVRTHRSIIAWMLYGFILFNGIVCSVGHGQMVDAFSGATQAMNCGDQGALILSDLSKMGDHALIMKLSMSDCAFAGIAFLSLMFFIGLGWLLSTRQLRLSAAYTFHRRIPRHLLPGLLPQAP